MASATVDTLGADAGQAGDMGFDAPYQVTEDQIKSLREKGWAKLPGLLSKEAAAKICETLLAIPAKSLLSGPGAPTMEETKLIMHEAVSWKNPFIKSVALSPRLGGAAAALMELPEAILVQDISFLKQPGGIETPFHQDYSYWPFDREGCLTFWIALEDMEPEMGPLRYLEGSHVMGPLGFIENRDIRNVYPRLRDAKVGGGEAMKAGDAQAHWGLTVHGSASNAGNARRSALAFRYHRSDVCYTGIRHPNYDRMNLKVGQKLVESPEIWRVGPKGVIEGLPETGPEEGGRSWSRNTDREP